MSSIAGALGAFGGSGNIGSAVVKMYLDTTQYNEQLAATKDETAAATEQSGAAASQFSGIATAAYATAGIAVLGFAKSAIDAASAHQQAIAALTVQVGDSAQAFQDQANALQAVSGVQRDAIIGADTVLSRFKLTQSQVEQLIPHILDLAQATGKSVPDAANAVGKALLGNTRILKQLGISYTATGNTAVDFANIIDALNQKVGGQAAAYAETYAGKLDILNARFEDLKQAVGGGLITELSGVADALNNTSATADKATGSSSALGDAAHKVFIDFNPFVEQLRLSEAYLNGVAHAAGITTGSTDGLTQATTQATTATKAWGDGINTAAEAQAKLAEETRKATQAQQAQRLAQLQAAGGLLGLVSSLQQVKQDQAALNKLQAEGKTNTAAYRAEVVKATTDELAFRTAVRQYVADNPNRSLSQTRDALREMATQAGATGQQFRDALGGPLKDIIASLDNLQSKRVGIQVDSSQLDLAQARADRLRQTLARGL